jgi:hypothetical protein
MTISSPNRRGHAVREAAGLGKNSFCDARLHAFAHRIELVTPLLSIMDIPSALSHNSALMTRHSARPRRIDEFDPEHAR